MHRKNSLQTPKEYYGSKDKEDSYGIFSWISIAIVIFLTVYLLFESIIDTFR